MMWSKHHRRQRPIVRTKAGPLKLDKRIVHIVEYMFITPNALDSDMGWERVTTDSKGRPLTNEEQLRIERRFRKQLRRWERQLRNLQRIGWGKHKHHSMYPQRQAPHGKHRILARRHVQ